MGISISVAGQMRFGDETRFGYEWIQNGQDYFRFKLGEDGLYRITYSDLINAGIPADQIPSNQYQLTALGEEIRLYTSTDGPLQEGDYLEFYGQKNRGQLDRFLYTNPDQDPLNPAYSMFTDSMAYFLTWNDRPNPLRYQEGTQGIRDGTDLVSRMESNLFTNRFIVRNQSNVRLPYKYGTFEEGEGFGLRWNKDPIEVPVPPYETINSQLILRWAPYHGFSGTSVLVNGTEKLLFGELPILQVREDTIPLDPADLDQPLQLLFPESSSLKVILVSATFLSDVATSVSGNASFSFSTNNVPGAGVLQWEAVDSSRIIIHEQSGLRWNIAPGSSNSITLAPGNTSMDNNYYSAPEQRIRSIGQMQKVNLLSPDRFEGDYLLFAQNQWLQSGRAAESYAGYRSSAAGGGYDVQTISIEDLYHTFGFGIDQHPMAFRNLVHYLEARGQLPQYALLVGKGYALNWVRDERSELRNQNQVPTFGVPGSDNLLFGDDDHIEGLIPVGRIAAQTEQEVMDYLEKVKTHEQGLKSERTTANHLWRKRGVHLAGGDLRTSEHFLFKNFLEGLAEDLNQDAYGGQVTVFGKSEDNPGSISEQVVNSLEEGAGIKLFLGHGGVVNTDFGLDDPDFFNLAPRYPLTFSLGCYSGNYFTPENSLSEQFLLAKEKGSLLYIGSTDVASANNLTYFSRIYYRLLSREYYARGQGELMQALRKELLKERTVGLNALVQLISFHGDPAVRLNISEGPDYTLDPTSFSVSPQRPSTLSDQVSVRGLLANIGQQLDTTTVLVQLRHTRPDGSQRTYLDSVVFEGSEAQFDLDLPLTENQPGLHRLEIQLDPTNVIEEFPTAGAESNNELILSNGEKGITFLVREAFARVGWPGEFDIVTEDSISLIANAPEGKQLVWELDTSYTYSSPFKMSHQSQEEGIIHRWSPDIEWTANQVYYWRVQLVQEDNLPIWDESSFLYLPDGQSGWNQSTFGQFQKTGLAPLRIDSVGQRFQFPVTQNSVVVQAVERQGNGTRSRILINNERIFNFTSNRPSIAIRYLDTLSMELLPGAAFNLQIEDNRLSCMDFLRKEPPPGALSIIVSIQFPTRTIDTTIWKEDLERWGENIPSVLSDLGTGLARAMDTFGLQPYLLILDEKEVLAEKLAPPEEFSTSHLFFLNTPNSSATVTSLPIGPAQDWQKVSWKVEGAGDSLALTAGRLNEEDPQLIPEETLVELSVPASDSTLVQLSFFSRDTLNRRFPGLEYWRVFFEPFPDLVAEEIRLSEDSLYQGDPLELDLISFNQSVSGAGPVPVQLELSGPENVRFEFSGSPVTLGGLSQMASPFSLSSSEWPSGDYIIRATLDPEGTITDQNPINNQIETSFFLIPDQTSPILQVRFDGRSILNGELVSSNPVIQVKLTDDSPLLVGGDSIWFFTQLTYPNGEVRLFEPSDPEYLFLGVEDGKQWSATLELNLSLEQSGRYQLRVQGRDQSGNLAGSLPYEVTFEVETRSSLSRVLPYPNPFSTSTRFQYTLTGDAPPQEFILQIMTVSGEIIREIDEIEFGPLQIGTHLSDFIWDGTDQFGDRLANGVYLYRVLVYDPEGKAMETAENPAIEGFFKGGIGKVVLLR